MNAENISRWLRGAIGNAVVWGAGWATLGLAAFTAFKITGSLSADASWLDGIGLAARFGIIGGVAGTAFSGVVGLLYRGRRLADLSAARFGVGGAVLTALFVPAFFQTMNILSGDGMVPMRYVADDMWWAALFGGLAAGVSLKVAQRAPLLSGGSRPGMLGSGDPFAGAEERAFGRRGAPAWRGGAD